MAARERVDAATVHGQLELLLHRGPDAVGVFDDGRGAVGQTRLSIIDLETGDPPITNEDRTVGVALNGEIYNHRTLQASLRSRGHYLKTAVDTEVIAHLAEDLEPVDIAKSLDGMFAFAVWDAPRERLVLGRDRFGKKPLYYYAGNESFVFGSEIKAVLAHPAVPNRLNEGALPAYLTLGYVPTPDTFFEGIHSIPPGHVLVLEKGSDPELQRYWELPLPVNERGGGIEISFDEAATEARALLRDAVRKRLISDVPLGAFLSGGIDSSAVVALMAHERTDPVKTFTIGFENAGWFDERPYAREVAEYYGTDHTEFVVRADAVELVEKLVWHHDQPFGDSSAVPTYLLSELTRREVKVALCGDGGDEIFAGYERFSAGLASDRYARLPRALRTTGRALVELLPPAAFGGRAGSVQRFVRRADQGLPDAYRSWIDYVQSEHRAALLPGADDRGLDDYRRKWDASHGAPALYRLLDLNIRTYLLDDLLPKVDRMSMAHGLEARSPFLDHRLATFAFSIPPSMHMKGFARKRLLKAALDGIVPRSIMQRRKHGFGVPLDMWFRHDLAGYLDKMLGSRDSLVRSYLHPGSVDQMIAEHRSGSADLGHALWTLLTLEVFLRSRVSA